LTNNYKRAETIYQSLDIELRDFTKAEAEEYYDVSTILYSRAKYINTRIFTSFRSFLKQERNLICPADLANLSIQFYRKRRNTESNLTLLKKVLRPPSDSQIQIKMEIVSSV
jgi:hypothetical protein